MKIFLNILLLIFIVSCSNEKESEKKHIRPERVVISGKVINFNKYKDEVIISPNRLGYYQEQLYANLDSLGYFSISFESYIPTDIWLKYETNFLILTHPGDSIYVEFDGEKQSQTEVLSSIVFKGDAAKMNQDAAILQNLYFSNAFISNWNAKYAAIAKYNLIEYTKFLDTINQNSISVYNEFISNTSPNEETKNWALTLCEQDYYDALAFYPTFHKQANQLRSSDWDVPPTYYNSLLDRLPISKSMLISGYAISNFINRFHFDYAHFNVLKETNFKNLSSKERDSLTVYGLIKYTPDTLLRQMVLTEIFSQDFENSEIDLYENYQHIVDKYIQEPFLKEPLKELYYQTKYRLENPNVANNATLKKLDQSSVSQIIEKIKYENKNKVIYVDCWATWCSPCRAEIPNSKELMKQLHEKDVAFVYVCVNSEENVWKATLDEFKIGGQHYLLNKKQSSDFTKALGIQGIPYYFIMNKKGVIIEKGSHLIPKIAKRKIKELLKEKNEL